MCLWRRSVLVGVALIEVTPGTRKSKGSTETELSAGKSVKAGGRRHGEPAAPPRQGGKSAPGR